MCKESSLCSYFLSKILSHHRRGRCWEFEGKEKSVGDLSRRVGKETDDIIMVVMTDSSKTSLKVHAIVSMFPKLIGWNPNAWLIVLGCGALGKCLGNGVEPSWMGFALIKETPQSSCSPSTMWGYSQKAPAMSHEEGSHQNDHGTLLPLEL